MKTSKPESDRNNIKSNKYISKEITVCALQESILLSEIAEVYCENHSKSINTLHSVLIANADATE
jgi:hypothetical protein